MILTEYFWEGIVLLASLLCAPYEVFYVESKNSRDYEVEPLSEKQISTFKKFFKQDYMLYDYFNKTLHKKVKIFGHQVSFNP